MTWGLIAGAAISTVGGALLADDNGAEAANAAGADASRMQAEIGRDQWDRYKRIFGPIEEQWVQESQGIDSMANQNRVAQRAAADVASGFAGARERLAKNPGVDPGSQAYLQEQNRINLTEAATSASAQTGAREMIRDKGKAARTDVVQVGKGMPASAVSSLSSASSGLRAAGQYAQNRADESAAGFGRMVGGITGSKGFQDWMRTPNFNPGAPEVVPVTPDNPFGVSAI